MDKIESTIDKKLRTIVLKTDYEFTAFKIEKWRDKFHYSFIKNNCQSMGSVFFFNQFGGRKYYPSNIEVKSIDFIGKRVNLSYTRETPKNNPF